MKFSVKNHKGNENAVKLIIPVLNFDKNGFLTQYENKVKISMNPESRIN